MNDYLELMKKIRLSITQARLMHDHLDLTDMQQEELQELMKQLEASYSTSVRMLKDFEESHDD